MKTLVLVTLLIATPALAQDINLKWEAGLRAKKYNVYTGPAVNALVKQGETSELHYSYKYTGEGLMCSGVSASNEFGESVIQTKTDTGEDICVGKPQAPKGFSFTVQ